MASKLNVELVKGILLVVVMLIMVFTALGDTATDLGAAAGNITCDRYNSTGHVVDAACTDAEGTYPLTSFFKKKGIIFLALMAGIVIVIIGAVLSMKK